MMVIFVGIAPRNVLQSEPKLTLLFIWYFKRRIDLNTIISVFRGPRYDIISYFMCYVC